MIENIIEVAKRNNFGYILISEADSEFQTLAKKLKGKDPFLSLLLFLRVCLLNW